MGTLGKRNPRFSTKRVVGAAGATILTFLSAPAEAQVVSSNEDVSFKQGKPWGGWTRDSSGTQTGDPRPTKAFQSMGGLPIAPFPRNGLAATLSCGTLDTSPIATVIDHRRRITMPTLAKNASSLSGGTSRPGV
jgi:hypothetical protein